jgi:NAD(P)-dependent dehydrogenase (short-subunit alcohol dehydrogenase family)
MIDAGWGRIVNVSSILGRVAIAGQSAYAASKGGVDQLTKVMALEWAPHGVCVNALSPGYVNIERMRVLYKGTPVLESSVAKTPLGRWAEVEDIAGPAVFLSSPAAAFMTGHALVVDGGWTIQ